VLTDNGSSHCSAIHAIACRALRIRHMRARPYRPQTKRQGRAAHPHTARRLGLRRRLPQLNRTRRCPRRLTVVLQPTNEDTQPRPQAPDRPPHRANQPSRDLHLCIAAIVHARARAPLSATRTAQPAIELSPKRSSGPDATSGESDRAVRPAVAALRGHLPSRRQVTVAALGANRPSRTGRSWAGGLIAMQQDPARAATCSRP
jgi:hypothetical protein